MLCHLCGFDGSHRCACGVTLCMFCRANHACAVQGAVKAWPHQDYQHKEVWRLIDGGEKRILITSPTGGGKCLGEGTPVLMFDGTIKLVEDIRIDDMLMGPDSTPRLVVSTCCGRDRMYQVTPKKGNPYTVNGDHILSLKLTGGASHNRKEWRDGSIVNISVTDYLQQPQSFKHVAAGYRVGVEFQPSPVPIDPYFLGMWLGDGSSRQPEITTADHEVVTFLQGFADSHSLKLVHRAAKGAADTWAVNNGKRVGRGGRNVVQDALRSLDVIENKHIPMAYLVNSREVRLQVLAGILDADGHLARPGNFNAIFKSKPLADGVTYLCRSLGFAAYQTVCQKTCVNNGRIGTYHRISISGNLDQIPNKIARKQSLPRGQKKDVLVSGIKVTPAGIGTYCGFEVEGPDCLFLLGDFTVTHNSLMQINHAKEAVRRKMRVFWYVNRRVLLDQSLDKAADAGLEMGLRAAGFNPDDAKYVQLASMQTDYRRMGRFDWGEFDADLLLIDEAHGQKGQMAQAVRRKHDAIDLGFTATAIGLKGHYDHLVVAGTNSELRKCGAHVICETHAPTELDTECLKHVRGEEWDYANESIRSAIFGDVRKNLLRVMPDPSHVLLFAPGVEASKWFAMDLTKNFIPAAHIDGERIWWKGREYESNSENRKELLTAFDEGRDPRVLCNRFVMREGADIPKLRCGVIATVFSTITAYLQAGGRLLRAHPSKEKVVLMDHGGHWWRPGFGDLNDDRTWSLDDDDAKRQTRERELRKKGKASEPILCGKCGRPRLHGAECECGHRHKLSTRHVYQIDGSLKRQTGAVIKKQKNADWTDDQRKWNSLYWMGKNANLTFGQLRAMFRKDVGHYPPENLMGMPKDNYSWDRRVNAVHRSDLHLKPEISQE